MSAKLDLKFIDCTINRDYIQVKSDIKFVHIQGFFSNLEFDIHLDIPTAIKFAKTLRTEINKAKEVENG